MKFRNIICVFLLSIIVINEDGNAKTFLKDDQSFFCHNNESFFSYPFIPSYYKQIESEVLFWIPAKENFLGLVTINDTCKNQAFSKYKSKLSTEIIQNFVEKSLIKGLSCMFGKSEIGSIGIQSIKDARNLINFLDKEQNLLKSIEVMCLDPKSEIAELKDGNLEGAWAVASSNPKSQTFKLKVNLPLLEPLTSTQIQSTLFHEFLHWIPSSQFSFHNTGDLDATYLTEACCFQQSHISCDLLRARDQSSCHFIKDTEIKKQCPIDIKKPVYAKKLIQAFSNLGQSQIALTSLWSIIRETSKKRENNLGVFNAFLTGQKYINNQSTFLFARGILNNSIHLTYPVLKESKESIPLSSSNPIFSEYINRLSDIGSIALAKREASVKDEEIFINWVMDNRQEICKSIKERHFEYDHKFLASIWKSFPGITPTMNCWLNDGCNNLSVSNSEVCKNLK